MKHVIDAQNQVLGRLASKIAFILQGKTHPNYTPRLPGTDHVVVKNASKIAVTGRKETQKIYYHHTGYIGHLRALKYHEQYAKNPERILWMTVSKMLPKNKLRKLRLQRLTIEK